MDHDEKQLVDADEVNRATFPILQTPILPLYPKPSECLPYQEEDASSPYRLSGSIPPVPNPPRNMNFTSAASEKQDAGLQNQICNGGELLEPHANKFSSSLSVLQQHVATPSNNSNLKQIMPGSFPLKRSCFSAQRRVARLRGRVLALRGQLVDQRSKCLILRRHSQEVQGKFMSMLDPAVEKGNLEHAQPELAQTYQEIRESNAELNQQESHTLDLEDRLCVLEYRLGKLEDRLYQDRETGLEDYETGYGYTGTSSEGITVTSSNGTTHDNAPPCLQELYSRMGDLKILQDRLEDFEFEFQQELRNREARLSQGEAVLPEDEFLESYKPEEDQIRAELVQAETDVQDLRKLCLREGINPDDEIFLPNSEVHSEPFTVPPEIEGATVQQYPLYPMRPYGNSPPTGHIFSGILTTRDRINAWLKEILYGNDLDTPMPDPNDEAPDCESRTWIKLVRNPSQQPPISSRYSLVASIGGLEAFRRTLESHRSHFKLLRQIRSDPGLPTSRPEASEIKTRHRAAFSIA